MSYGEIPGCTGSRYNQRVFYYMAEAFNLAEKYQCVVLVASDLFVGMSSSQFLNLIITQLKLSDQV